MRSRLLLVTLCFCLHVSGGASLAGEVSPETIRIRRQVLEYEEQVNSASDGRTRRAALSQMEAFIRGSGASAEEMAQFLMWTGHCYYDVQDYGSASRLFQEVHDMPAIGAFWRIDAARMLAQQALVQNEYSSASDLYGKMLDEIDRATDPRVRATAHTYLEDAYSKGAYSLSLQGQYETSVQWRTRALEDARLRLDADARSWLTIENARDCTKVGKYEDAIALYDSVFRENETFGFTNGDIVTFRMEQVGAYQWPPTEPRRLALVLDVWSNKEYAKYPQILAVGSGLEKAYYEAGDLIAAIRVGEELLERMLDQRANADASIKSLWSIDDRYASCLLHLSQRYVELGAASRAIEVLEMFLAAFPGHGLAGAIEHRLEHLRQDDSRGRLDLDALFKPDELPLEGHSVSTSGPAKDGVSTTAPARHATSQGHSPHTAPVESRETLAWQKGGLYLGAGAVCAVALCVIGIVRLRSRGALLKRS